MAPEQVSSLIAVVLRLEEGRLLADGERVELLNAPLYVSWYTTSPSTEQIPIADGLVHVWNAPRLTRQTIRNASPADLGDGTSGATQLLEGGR